MIARSGAFATAALALVIAAPLFAAPFEPTLVRVPLRGAVTMEQLLRAGLDIVAVKAGDHADVLEWPGDDATLAGLGARPQVLDAHPSTTAAARAAAEQARPPRAGSRVKSATGPDGAFEIQTLPPFGQGSMGGYWTLAEVKMELDSLVAADTHDIVADKLDTLGYSLQGRPIWGLELSKHVTGTDTRPVAFYNALTHAREPEGMQALFYFVNDVLSRYGIDPWATYLLDHRRLYIVPVVNPDGYEINHQLFPNGGGLQRKNARDTSGDGVFTYTSHDGVDLNRNFGYQWGFDNIGSSGTGTSETYRGASPFSEPETQAQRDAVVRLQPRTGLSFHTYSDLFLHPWGWTDAAAPDSQAFYEWNDEATLGSGYATGNSTRVLYAVNGEFNDWTYGETVLKPRAFTWTPEIGDDDDGFWPTPSRILPLAEENLRKCYTVAAIAGPYARVERSAFAEGELDAGHLAHLAVRARNLGLDPTPAPLTATLVSLDPGIEVFPDNAHVTYPAMASRTSADADTGGVFVMAAADTVTPGRLARLEIRFTGAGGYFSRDTIDVLLGHPTTLLIDDASTLANWNAAGGWGVVQNDPRHPSRYFADSPAGIYPSNDNATLIGRAPFNLSHGVHAWMLLENRWNFEQDYDGGLAEASLDSVNWVVLPARSSTVMKGVTGTSVPGGTRAWGGARWLWKPDRVDLSSVTGPTATAVRLRFRSRSDTGADFDGLNVDSIRVLLFDPAAQPAPAAVTGSPARALAFARPSPNPARGITRLDFALPRGGSVALDVFDASGRRVRVLASGRYAAGHYALAWDLADDLGRPVAPGVYLARLVAPGGALTRRIVVLGS